jgi:hypothetical protein
MLIVSGTQDDSPVRRVLEANLHPEVVTFTNDPFRIADALVDGAVLGYADSALAEACTGRGIEFTAARRKVVLAFAWRPNPDEGPDMVAQAGIVLKADAILDLNYPAAIEYLRKMLVEV